MRGSSPRRGAPSWASRRPCLPRSPRTHAVTPVDSPCAPPGSRDRVRGSGQVLPEHSRAVESLLKGVSAWAARQDMGLLHGQAGGRASLGLTSQKVSIKSFLKSHTNTKNQSTDLCGNRLLQKQIYRHFLRDKDSEPRAGLGFRLRGCFMGKPAAVPPSVSPNPRWCTWVPRS